MQLPSMPEDGEGGEEVDVYPGGPYTLQLLPLQRLSWRWCGGGWVRTLTTV